MRPRGEQDRVEQEQEQEQGQKRKDLKKQWN